MIAGWNHQATTRGITAALAAADNPGPAWHRDARCAGVALRDPETFDAVFFPEKPGQQPREQRELREALCGSCPVARQCGLAGQREEYGLWGVPRAERQAA